jgi:hypothetical protein
MKKPFQPKHSEDRLTVEYDEEDFKKMLPNLAKELLNQDSGAKIPIDGLEHTDYEDAEDQIHEGNDTEIEEEQYHEEIQPTENSEKHLYDRVKQREDFVKSQGSQLPDKELYNPGAEDFIRRCKTEKEAEEIIIYLVKRGEITPQQATDLKLKLQNDGLRAFGPKKTWGYYERKYRPQRFENELE